MPTPAYILFARDVEKDQSTNLISLTSVVERMVIDLDRIPDRARDKTNGQVMLPVQFRGVAVWLRDKGDEGKTFESELVFINPNGDEDVKAHSEFEFAAPFLQRFFLKIASIPMVTESGILTVESRVRRKGNKRWKSQSYPILIQVKGE